MYNINNYIILAIKRHIILFVFLEITWTFNIIILLIMEYHKSSSNLIKYENICINILLIILVLIVIERVPFDIIEAESELIDGLTIELEGVVFSLLYSSEIILCILIIKLLIYHIGLIIIYLLILIIIIYWGRSFLTRFLFNDIIEILFSIWLIYSFLIMHIVVYELNNTVELNFLTSTRKEVTADIDNRIFWIELVIKEVL